MKPLLEVQKQLSRKWKKNITSNKLIALTYHYHGGGKERVRDTHRERDRERQREREREREKERERDVKPSLNLRII